MADLTTQNKWVDHLVEGVEGWKVLFHYSLLDLAVPNRCRHPID